MMWCYNGVMRIPNMIWCYCNGFVRILKYYLVLQCAHKDSEYDVML